MCRVGREVPRPMVTDDWARVHARLHPEDVGFPVLRTARQRAPPRSHLPPPLRRPRGSHIRAPRASVLVTPEGRKAGGARAGGLKMACLLYTSPSPRDS